MPPRTDDATSGTPTMDSSITYRGNASVATTVNHPRLVKFEPESIRVFLRAYDSYCNEVRARAEQLVLQGAPSTAEVARPVNLKYCVETEYLHAAIILKRIPDVTSYDDLDDEKLRKFLDEKAKESEDTVTLATLDKIVADSLRINMNDKNVKSRMETLFISYIMILRRHGLAWVTEKNQKVAVNHVLSAIRPNSLQRRIEDDLQFSKSNLKKDFDGFMDHVINLADAYQKVQGEGSKQHNQSSNLNRGSSAPNRAAANQSRTSPPRSPGRSNTKSRRPLPPCPYSVCKSKGLKHWIVDCRNSNDEEKQKMREELSRMKSSAGPSASTRAQSQASSTSKGSANQTSTARRIDVPSPHPNMETEEPDTVTVADGITTLDVKGRCDDGADDSLASKSTAEKAALLGIGHIQSVPRIEVQMPVLGEDTKPIIVECNRIWHVPRTILRVASGKLALLNISYLIIEGELSPENILIGRPVLTHLGVDTNTLLDKNRLALHEQDCSDVGNPTAFTRRISLSRITTSGTPEDSAQSETSDINNNNSTSTNHSSQQNTTNSAQPMETPNQDNSENNIPFEERPRKNYFKNRNESDPFPDQSLLDNIDNDQTEEVTKAINQLLENTNKSSLPLQYQNQLSTLLHENRDVFRVRMSAGPPADIPPLVIQLSNDAKPVRIKLRNYSPPQRIFLSQFVSQLLKKGIVYSNPTSSWASAPLLVPKSGPSQFRFTVDLRPINKYTVQHQYPMPNLEQELNKLAGSKYFANLDFSNAYWQLPLHPDSQHLQSFITPDGIYSPTRVLHGTTNAVTHLQSSLMAILTTKLREHVLIWLDDILVFASTIEELFEAISEFIKLCRKHHLYIHPEKCILFTKSIRWCGRIITPQGVLFNPSDYQGLCDMETPKTGSQLQQFLCALQWIRTSIPEFSKLTQPLREILNVALAKSKSRTKRAASKISLESVGWGKVEDDCFSSCKKVIAKQVTLAHRDHTKRLNLFTDASDKFWSGVVTQIPPHEVGLAHDEQHHEPLAFLSGHFNITQLAWSTLEKEAYAILASTQRMHWLLATPDGFDLFTDHNNLVFIFDPLAVVTDLSQTAVKKILRWAVRMSLYNYICYHIKGSDNVWADLISRWMPNPSLRRLVFIPPLVSSTHEDFEWPSINNIRSSQISFKKKLDNAKLSPQNADAKHKLIGLKLVDGVLRDKEQRIWIPDDDDDLQLRLCIIGHTGPAGHRGVDTTRSNISNMFTWNTLQEDVKKFIQACIHCISTTKGIREPRPFGPALHGTSANDLIQFDFIEMGPSTTGMKYILMIRDDFSSYSWFLPFSNANAENAADALLEWATTFTIPKGLMSDGGTHFRNETVRILTKSLQVPHHFTLPYTPWSNGGIERLGREILRIFRATLSETRKPFTEWPSLVPILQSSLNNSPSPQRGNRPPITIFMGQPATTPISVYKTVSSGKVVPIEDTIKERFKNLDDAKTLLENIHPLVQTQLDKSRTNSRQSQSRGKSAKFEKGDFVLVAKDEIHKGEKLALRWRGPRRVINAISDWIYCIEDLRNNSKENIHASRLRLYADKHLNTEAIMPHVLYSETGMPISRLMSLEKSNDQLMVHVRWKGLPQSEDTLEPIKNVYEDVPKMLSNLLKRKSINKKLHDEASEMIHLWEKGV